MIIIQISLLSKDAIKFNGGAITEDFLVSKAIRIDSINLNSFNASLHVRETLTLYDVVFSNAPIDNQYLNISVADSAVLNLKGTVCTSQLSPTSLSQNHISLTRIMSSPGGTVILGADSIIFEHMVKDDQSFTNTNDFDTKLIFNDQINAFELQPMGELEDLV